jgi:hypothetical protein
VISASADEVGVVVREGKTVAWADQEREEGWVELGGGRSGEVLNDAVMVIGSGGSGC